MANLLLPVLLAIFAYCAFVNGDEARLLGSKFLLSQYAVENKDFVVDYNIYNIGDKAALHVELSDDTFPTTDFEIMRGLFRVKWDRIAPGGNVSHSVILRPKAAGVYNLTSALLTYLPSEDATEARKAATTAPGETYVYRLKDYERKFSPHIMDWGLFGIMTLPSLAIPYLLWYRSKSKYDTLAAHTKKQ